MAEQSIKLDGVKVLLGVSGGIAAYKAADLASKLTQAGATVKTVMTESALQMIGAKTFEAVTGQQVYTNMWIATEEYEIGHVSLADWADVAIVAPATANIIGKMANGICDDLLSTVLCARWNKALLFAPAMNDKMWTNPAVQKNVQTLRSIGTEIVGPETGRLACGTEGVGRMSEPQDIIKAIVAIVAKSKK
jgi:phosphopantothenoylcysteine decarboxylase/phosphopantothenate--cysteine ligase